MRKNFTQKLRHEVAVQRFAAPARDAAPRDQEEFWLNRHKYPKAANALWQDAGPCNFTGRITCLAGDPKTLLAENSTTPSVLYAGSAAGGLWKSANWGGNWESCWPASLNQNIGAVAIDPKDPLHIVCATGEGNLASATYPGSGVYESNDGAFTWLPYGYVPGKRRLTAEDRDHGPRRVASISISANGNLAFGTVSNDDELPGGLYMVNKRNELGFVTEWSRRPYNCYSALYHPTDPETLYVSIEAGGSVNGVYRSRNGGESWARSKGLPPGEECGRISLAISSNQPRVLFALVSSRPTGSRLKGNKGQQVRGVYRSKDGGDTWEECPDPKGVFRGQRQLGYNNTIAIHPDNPDIIVCGAVGLFLTEDGGETWRSISTTDPGPRNLHADQHAILMPGGKTIYVGNDGGVFKSLNLGERSEFDEHGFRPARPDRRAEATQWQPANHGMNTILFYAIDVSAADQQARIFGGGTQDNGTLLAGVKEGTGFRKKGDLAFTKVLPGDGGYVVFDPDDKETVFGSTFSTETHRHHPGKRWGLNKTASWERVDPPVPAAEKKVANLTVMAIKAARPGHAAKLFLGTNRLWWTTYRKRKPELAWKTSPFDFDGSAISAIEIAAADPEVMYIGTAKGGIFRLRGGNQYEEWSEDLAGPEIPNHVITQIETHPKDARIVVVTVASTSRSAVVLDDGHREMSPVMAAVRDSSGRAVAGVDLTVSRPGGGRLPIGTQQEVVTTDDQGLARMFSFDSLNQPHPHSHVFRSTDSGQTWEDIDRGPEAHPQLPNVVMNGLAFETRPPYRLFVAGDAGTWVLGSDGRWASISGNLPSAVISDIIYHHGSKTLFAGTYGRGIWRMKVPRDFDIHPARQELDAETAPVEGYLLDPSVPGPEPLKSEIVPGRRRVKLTAREVAGASRYVFEIVIESLMFSVVNSSTTPAIEMNVSTTGNCVWQCWALFDDERCSLPSREMRFTI